MVKVVIEKRGVKATSATAMRRGWIGLFEFISIERKLDTAYTT